MDGRIPESPGGSRSAHSLDARPGAERQRLRRTVRTFDPRGVLDHLILFGERRLLHVLKECVVHYHEERNHQGLDNDLIAPAPRAIGSARVRCRERLGGLLRYYYQAA